jgi:hypothetical protein
MWAQSSIGRSTHRRGRDEVEWGMSPHRLIEGAAFDPEVIALLIQAYQVAVTRVGEGQPLPVLETLAKRIIEIAARGERDPQKMTEYAVRGVEPFPDAGSW